MENNLRPNTRVVFVLTAPSGSDIASGTLLSGSLEEIFAHYLSALGMCREEVGIITLFPRPSGYTFRPKGIFSTKAKSPHAYGKHFVTPEFHSRAAHLIARLLDLPNLAIVFPLGVAPTVALIGQKDITSWNGSINTHPKLRAKVIPLFDPNLVQRKWEWLKDAKRGCERGKLLLRGQIAPKIERFSLRPSLNAIRQFLSPLPLDALIAVDIETACEHILCIGIATSPSDAICIPFVDEDGDVYSEEEELDIILLLQHILTTRRVIGQNFHYDAQYIARWWGFIPTSTSTPCSPTIRYSQVR